MRAFLWVFLWVSVAWAQPLKLMSFNVENFNLEDRLVEGVFYKDYPKPEKQKAALIAAIAAEAPDILAVQEMGDEKFLAEFQLRLRSVGLVYPYAALVKAADPKRHVALLSRVPFQPVCHAQVTYNDKGEAQRVLRGLLEARFQADDARWRVYVVHLKSRMSRDKDDPLATRQRTSEAHALRDLILNTTQASDAFFIVGDFNDGPRSSPLKRFLIKGKREITQMLPAVDLNGDVWTHHWKSDGSYSRIDYILASPPMLDAVVPGSAQVVESPQVRQASDHRPVVVQFDPQKLKGAYE